MFGRNVVVVVCLLACLACVIAMPPSLHAYKGESGEAILLNCRETTSAIYRCRPLRRRDLSSLPSPGQYSNIQEEDGEDAMEIVEEDDDNEEEEETARSPKCEVYEIYVPELNKCVDVIDHLRTPVLKDPRVARWYSWRNTIVDARRRARGF